MKGTNCALLRLKGFVVYSVCEKRKWRCTEKLCDGVCRTVGEGHYISFDGLKYSFPGLCQYVLVQVKDPKWYFGFNNWYQYGGKKTPWFISMVYLLFSDLYQI